MDKAILLEEAHGEVVGRDPRDMTGEELAAAGVQGQPVLDAIRAKCVDCSGGSRTEAGKCVAVGCALWPFRMGTNPFRLRKTHEELSSSQIAARAAFADRARERAKKIHEANG